MTKLTFNLITIRVVAPTRSTTSSLGTRHVRALRATISQKTNERINHSPRVPALPSPELLAPLCRSTKPTGRPSRSHACLWKANSQPGGKNREATAPSTAHFTSRHPARAQETTGAPATALRGQQHPKRSRCGVNPNWGEGARLWAPRKVPIAWVLCLACWEESLEAFQLPSSARTRLFRSIYLKIKAE